MKILIVLVILALMGMASAETVNLGNCTVSFNYNKPHQNIIEQNLSSMIIETFDGKISISVNPVTTLDVWNTIKDKDCKQSITINDINSELLTSGDLFALVNQYYMVDGNMPFFDLADFLKTLKIEKRA